MRHVIAGAILIAIALAVTFGAASVLQDAAVSRTPQANQEYVPPSIKTSAPRAKPAEPGRSVFMSSRRMNDNE